MIVGGPRWASPKPPPPLRGAGLPQQLSKSCWQRGRRDGPRRNPRGYRSHHPGALRLSGLSVSVETRSTVTSVADGHSGVGGPAPWPPNGWRATCPTRLVVAKSRTRTPLGGLTMVCHACHLQCPVQRRVAMMRNRPSGLGLRCLRGPVLRQVRCLRCPVQRRMAMMRRRPSGSGLHHLRGPVMCRAHRLWRSVLPRQCRLLRGASCQVPRQNHRPRRRCLWLLRQPPSFSGPPSPLLRLRSPVLWGAMMVRSQPSRLGPWGPVLRPLTPTPQD